MTWPASRLAGALVVALAVTLIAVPATAAVVSVDVTTSPEPAPPGSNVTFSTTVSNLGPDDANVNVQRVELRTTADGNGELVEQRVVSRSLRSGEETSVALHEEFDQAGEYQRFVHVRIRESANDVTTAVRPVNVTVRQTHPATSLSSSTLDANGETDLTLTVANGLPDVVRGLEVELESDDLDVQQRQHVLSAIEAGAQSTVTTSAAADDEGEATVDATLSYVTADGESRSVTRTLSTSIDEGGTAAAIELTGLRIEEEGDELVVSGSASNLGSANVSSVLIAVGEGGNGSVEPAQTEDDYFVGGIPGNDFESFTVRAALPEDPPETTTIPLEISYDRRGDRITRTVTREYSPSTDETEQSGNATVPLVLGLVVIAGGAIAWRRYR